MGDKYKDDFKKFQGLPGKMADYEDSKFIVPQIELDDSHLSVSNSKNDP